MPETPPTAPSPGPGRIRRLVVALVASGLLSVIILGLVNAPPTQADRAVAVASRLRCPVCQSVSIAESRSDTALAMQDRIRELIAAGASDADVVTYFTDRYGSWVLLDPPSQGFGLLLWLLPAGSAVVGAVLIARRRRSPTRDEPSPRWRGAVQDEVDRLRRRERDPTS